MNFNRVHPMDLIDCDNERNIQLNTEGRPAGRRFQNPVPRSRIRRVRFLDQIFDEPKMDIEYCTNLITYTCQNSILRIRKKNAKGVGGFDIHILSSMTTRHCSKFCSGILIIYF